MPPRPIGSGSTASAPRRDGWPGPSSGCSSWSAAAISAARSSGNPSASSRCSRRAVDELAPYLELRGQSVAIEVEPGLRPLGVDPDKIADVLINLLANAIKFTPDGGTIRVAASAEPGAPDWVRVSVSDEGLGVPAGDQQYLFEPFFTGFDTLHHSSGDYQFGKRGLGLGLWLVKTFVELHGGRVEVTSSHGQGSTFSFLLPRYRAVEEAPPTDTPAVPEG